MMEKMKYRDIEFTLWDSIDVAGDKTLAEFIDYFRDQHNLVIDSIYYGVAPLYMSARPKPERMSSEMSQLVELVTKQKIYPNVKKISLLVVCDDVEDIPDVHYYLSKQRMS